MKSSGNNAFARHVYAVQRYVSLTAPRYQALCKAGLVTHPICSFGDPEKAKIVTVGLNPSGGEFTPERNWPNQPMAHDKLAERCVNYFNSAHRWFQPWSEGLRHLGVSYEADAAVHLDLSPRATRPVSTFKTDSARSLFLEMVERDLWTFFGTLGLCRNAKLVMIAGTVTKDFYMDEYLRKQAPAFGFSLVLDTSRRQQFGRAKTSHYWLRGAKRNLRLFFCGSSPSDHDETLLPRRIEQNADLLRLR